jgi:hypothetical protein
VTDAVESNPARMKAMMPASSAGCSLNGGMPAGVPLVITRARSSSASGRRNWARRKSMPEIWSPSRP